MIRIILQFAKILFEITCKNYVGTDDSIHVNTCQHVSINYWYSTIGKKASYITELIIGKKHNYCFCKLNYVTIYSCSVYHVTKYSQL